MQGNNNSSVTPDIENLDYIIATKAVLILGYSREDVNRAFQICKKESSKLSWIVYVLLVYLLSLFDSLLNANTITWFHSWSNVQCHRCLSCLWSFCDHMASYMVWSQKRPYEHLLCVVTLTIPTWNIKIYTQGWRLSRSVCCICTCCTRPH